MQPQATKRLYLEDDRCFETEGKVLAVLENSIAFDQTCFYRAAGVNLLTRAQSGCRAERFLKSCRLIRIRTGSSGT